MIDLIAILILQDTESLKRVISELQKEVDRREQRDSSAAWVDG